MEDIEIYKFLIKKNNMFHGQTKEELRDFLKKVADEKGTRYQDPFQRIDEVVKVTKYGYSILLCISDKNTMSYFDGKKVNLIKRLFKISKMYLSGIPRSGDVWRRILHMQLNNDSWVSLACLDRRSLSELIEE